jgi:hypothetical protein
MDIQELLEYKLEQLKKDASWLSQKMNYLVQQIDERQSDVIVNSMGEVQTLGHTIDLLCAEIGLLKRLNGD